MGTVKLPAVYLYVIAFLIVVETTVVHIVLAQYVSVVFAWIATAMSISTAVWLVAVGLTKQRLGLPSHDPDR